MEGHPGAAATRRGGKTGAESKLEMKDTARHEHGLSSRRKRHKPRRRVPELAKILPGIPE
jgi:hypothetical protein